jgi:hypothetical protein
MLSAASPWSRGFESRFLVKSEICRIFLLNRAKIVFLTTPTGESVKTLYVRPFYKCLHVFFTLASHVT